MLLDYNWSKELAKKSWNAPFYQKMHFFWIRLSVIEHFQMSIKLFICAMISMKKCTKNCCATILLIWKVVLHLLNLKKWKTINFCVGNKNERGLAVLLGDLIAWYLSRRSYEMMYFQKVYFSMKDGSTFLSKVFPF